jgi:ArsR family transcriptional regulator
VIPGCDAPLPILGGLEEHALTLATISEDNRRSRGTSVRTRACGSPLLSEPERPNSAFDEAQGPQSITSCRTTDSPLLVPERGEGLRYGADGRGEDFMADKPVVADQIDVMFRAFCDRTRLRILSLLRDGELCVGDLVAVLQVPQPKVSRHLAQLRRAGLVETRRTGLCIHYSLVTAKTAFHRKPLECAVICFQEVPENKSDSLRAKAIRESGGCCP